MSQHLSTVKCVIMCLQEVNENSLKRLNGYLENLERPGSSSLPPMKLTFYVRDTKDKSEALLASGTRGIVLV